MLGQIWRSVRIVADIGCTPAGACPPERSSPEGEWTPELARRMLVDFALVEPALAGFEVDRYLGWPGRRSRSRSGRGCGTRRGGARGAARGGDFSLREFHREALGLGPMGLDPLRALLQGRVRSAPGPAARLGGAIPSVVAHHDADPS